MQNKMIQLNFKQLSNIVAALIFTSFFIFFAGYYLGKKVTNQMSLEYIQDNAFSDKLENAFYSLGAYQKEEELVSDNLDKPDNSDNLDNLSNLGNNTSNNIINTNKYAAHLAGFGTERAALACIDEFNKKGIVLEIRKRESKNKTKHVVWYQVVTPLFDSRKELDSFLSKLNKFKKFNNVDIVVIK